MHKYTDKVLLIKGLKLQKSFDDYKIGGNNKEQAFKKFVAVWGTNLAEHFLMKYDDAESLIWALDSENLKLFIDKY